MKNLLTLFIIFIGQITFGQITISNPLNNAIYQRNAASQANLVISGSYNANIVTAVQAKLTNADNNVVVIDWTIIAQNPSKGYYSGTLYNVPAGWYSLEVRSLKSGVVLNTTSLNRVGIGDVFMIAGQSNAQGYIYNNYLGASSPKVTTHNNGVYCSNQDFPFPNLTQLSGTVKPSSAGRDAWCYGKLGDDLVAQNGFPVAFFNSGASGASSENWKVSSDGQPTNNPFTGLQFCSVTFENNGLPYSVGLPYSNFKRGLNYYNSMFGARAVLWHQGESDRFLGISTAAYQSNVSYVINKSRADFSSNLPWVISRVSYESSTTSAAVISGQNNLINGSAQIFAGPMTDGVNNTTDPGSRDGIDLHFQNQGLVALANNWKAYLDPFFFNNASPIVANTPPVISALYVNASTLTIFVQPGYASYKWIRTDISGNSNFGNASEGSSNGLTRSAGTYRCWVTTSNGNMQISSEVNVNQALALSINSNCTTNVYASDLKYLEALNGLGPLEINKTNGGAFDGDGVPIVLKSVLYANGIGTNGVSEVTYQIPAGQYFKFNSKIGIGDEITTACNGVGGVIFKVYGDDNLIYTSPIIYKNSALETIDVNLGAYTRIKLRTEQASASACNSGVWADARFLCIGSDNTPPTNPTNLVVNDTLEKCLTFQWTASTDNLALLGYNIFKNGIYIGFLPPSATSYTMSGLAASQNVTFGIQAKDVANNLSSLISINLNTIQIDWDYLNDGIICVNRTYLPTIKIPANGVFSFVSGPPATIDPITGAFQTSTVYDPLNLPGTAPLLRYTIAQGVPACESFGEKNFAATNPPAITPVITADKTIVNIGTAVNLTSTPCTGSILTWSFNPLANNVSIANSPIANIVYRSSCKVDECYNYSNPISVKVIPNCVSSYNFLALIDNLSSNPNALIFSSSSTIQAVNRILPANNVIYSSANSITLNPGFTVSAGVKFTAKIQNCPN
jgi:NPCBM/NEW2 domain/Carbohydrate esterase, sialic acid-specific acetylesterase